MRRANRWFLFAKLLLPAANQCVAFSFSSNGMFYEINLEKYNESIYSFVNMKHTTWQQTDLVIFNKN